jgi:hypothetical protein
MSLYRLIDLAKRTGDRLIVHDPVNSRDVVIMDIDSYERLLDISEGEEFEPWDPGPEPSSRGSNKNSYADDEDSWNRAGDILADRYDNLPMDEEVGESDFAQEIADLSNNFPTEKPEVQGEDIQDWESTDGSTLGDARVEAEELKTIPIRDEQPLPPEEPGDPNGEPVFYEEPIV